MKYVALALACFLQQGRSREVRFEEGAAIEIRPAVSAPDRHATCVVAFPEDSLDSIVAAWNESDLSLEKRGNLLFLKLLRAVEGDLHVVGGSGTLYRLAIRPGDDGSVRIVRTDRRSTRPAPSLEFVRAMRLGRVPSDATVRRGAPGVLFRWGAAEASCRYVYESVDYLGYVLEIRNGGEEAMRLDPSRLRSPELVLAGAREMSVPAKGSTLLYLIFARKP